jgi:hypothetical protein
MQTFSLEGESVFWASQPESSLLPLEKGNVRSEVTSVTTMDSAGSTWQQ